VRIYADLHVHSRFSRATGKDATLRQFALWAGRKGLALVGTGDFTHPAWFGEIRDQLVPAEQGLFRLNPRDEEAARAQLPAACRDAVQPVRFILSVEVSTIYKAQDATRKVHHVIVVPDLAAAERLSRGLARIGNIASDGRPILGLDSRDLLEIALESGPGSFLIPAHVWTPWFSALGSKSGFDSIADCYRDLAGHIFAIETGLSSDPAMNRRVSALDSYRLVSNSDAHSPAKLAREACIFDADLSFGSIRGALETGKGYLGTIEFFPEEGKYHLDGHRKCNVRLEPAETRRNKGLCPVCGKPVTVGVMNRVEELADRPEAPRQAGGAAFRSAIPLPEILGEIIGAGPDTKGVTAAYGQLLDQLGPELFILDSLPLEELARKSSANFVEAVARMRDGRVIREGGYDGEYGTIRLFGPGELAVRDDAPLLLDAPAAPRRTRRKSAPAGVAPEQQRSGVSPAAVRETPEPYGTCPRELAGLDSEQRLAAETLDGPLMIVAGPGTGKTRTLTQRLAWLIRSRGADPASCLAITFTNRAAAEMRERLAGLLPPDQAGAVPVLTFHALGLRLIREWSGRLGFGAVPRVADEDEMLAAAAAALNVEFGEAVKALTRVSLAKRGFNAIPDPAADAERDAYDAAMRARGLLDFEDLIALPLALLERDGEALAQCRSRFAWVSVDEFQDVDQRQYRLMKLLAPPESNLCVIGDPDQAIYGFRGSDVRCFEMFSNDYPAARTVSLTRNYRSDGAIVKGAVQAIAPQTLVAGRRLFPERGASTRIVMHDSASEAGEAAFVARTVESLMGGASFHAVDSGRAEPGAPGSFAFSDFAVLYRTESVSAPVAEALARAGLPFQKRSHRRLAENASVRRVVAQMEAVRVGDGPAGRLEAVAASAPADDPGHAMAREALRPIAARCADMAQFRSDLALASDADLWDPRAQCVSLLTIHAAKGLEFPVVFVVGCEDGVLPLRVGKDTDMAEERRLFFVAMTRARDRLYLCRARRRSWRGTGRSLPPSPFLEDIERAIADHQRSESRAHLPRAEQMDLL
jgi:uncharacterized protein (TIGR00375 family)